MPILVAAFASCLASLNINQVTAQKTHLIQFVAYMVSVQVELDFALGIFKVAYTKRKFDGPCVPLFSNAIARIIPPAGIHWLFERWTTSLSHLV
jgi:hypothetical protein